MSRHHEAQVGPYTPHPSLEVPTAGTGTAVTRGVHVHRARPTDPGHKVRINLLCIIKSNSNFNNCRPGVLDCRPHNTLFPSCSPAGEQCVDIPHNSHAVPAKHQKQCCNARRTYASRCRTRLPNQTDILLTTAMLRL